MFRYLLYLVISLIAISLLFEVFKNEIYSKFAYIFLEFNSLIYGIFGFLLFYILSEGLKNKEKRSVLKFESSIVFSLILLICTVFSFWFSNSYFVVKKDLYENIFLYVILGFCLAIIFQQSWVWLTQKVTDKVAVESPLERSKQSDIRDFEKSMFEKKKTYDPTNYFKENAFFLALDEKNKPVYWDEATLPHIQVCGTTGCGKGVFLGYMAVQCLYKDEAVFVLDPKDDEWFPHVTYQAAKDMGKPSYCLNLNEEIYQFNIFEDSSPKDRFGMLSSAFGLEETGEGSDFYKLEERDLAHFVADNWNDGQTLERFFIEHEEYLFKTAKGFAYKLKELANIKSINAKNGLSFKDVVANGGIVYIIGSMDDSVIKKIQKMILTRILQVAKVRDRIQGNNRQICIVLDELKYHISRPALEALGAARDKGVHVIMAHQSYADLRDCTLDLNKDAVEGAVVENSSIKMIYRVEMPKTAKDFTEKSGTILIDKDIRFIENTLSGAEVVSSDHTVAQGETTLIDSNRLLTLPKQSGVLFGVGLAKIVHTSPYIAQKDYAAIQVQDHSSGEEIKPKTLDFEKL